MSTTFFKLSYPLCTQLHFPTHETKEVFPCLPTPQERLSFVFQLHRVTGETLRWLQVCVAMQICAVTLRLGMGSVERQEPPNLLFPGGWRRQGQRTPRRPGRRLSCFLPGYSVGGPKASACCLFLSSGTPSVVVLSRLVGREPKVQTGCRMIILGEIKRWCVCVCIFFYLSFFSFISFQPSQYLDCLRWSRSNLCQ